MKNIIIALVGLFISISGYAQLRIGEQSPEIELPNTVDSIIKLSSYQGKVVLVDFWASWCAPCRQANPYIQKLYKKHKANGFEVFAVSLDVKNDAWLNAVKKDKLTYTGVIDNLGWNSKIAERFYVDQLPTNFLLDRTGKIVAINIDGKELFDAVKKLVE